MNPQIRFFVEDPDGSIVEIYQCAQETSADIAHILSTIVPGSLLFLDIDDTIARVMQAMGLDPWFRLRIEQFKAEHYPDAVALARAIELYNQVQLASTQMIPVDFNNPIAPLLSALKDKGVKIIGLTARGQELTDKTLELLAGMGITFSDDVVHDATFAGPNGRDIKIKQGAIFASGNSKGPCLESIKAAGYMTLEPDSYPAVEFVDDGDRNCISMAVSLDEMGIPNCRVWHYTYAAEHLGFDDRQKRRSAVQEAELLATARLLSDAEADERLAVAPGM